MQKKINTATVLFSVYFTLALLIPFAHCHAAEELCHDLNSQKSKQIVFQQVSSSCCAVEKLVSSLDLHESDHSDHHYHFLSENPLLPTKADLTSFVVMLSECVLVAIRYQIAPPQYHSAKRGLQSLIAFKFLESVCGRVSGIAPPSSF